MTLPGIGSVTRNEQASLVNTKGTRLTINMIHIRVTLANALLPIGTQIIVATASSGARAFH